MCFMYKLSGLACACVFGLVSACVGLFFHTQPPSDFPPSAPFGIAAKDVGCITSYCQGCIWVVGGN
jgi:hypothetical protein